MIWRASQACVGFVVTLKWMTFLCSCEDDHGVEKAKRRSHNNEHVDGCGVAHVIVQERAPGWGGDRGPTWKISANRGLAHVEAELAGRTPERIGDTHLADQITDFPAHPGPSQVA